LFEKLDIPSRIGRVERADGMMDDVSDILEMYNNS
jgi:hypothetical protein